MATEYLVAVNVPSKFNTGEIRVKFEDTEDWYGADAELTDKLAVGNTVKIATSKKGKNVFIDKVKVVEEAPAGQPGTQSSKDYWAEKDKHQREVIEPRLTYQDARRDALAFLAIQATAGTLALGSGKAEKKAELLTMKLDELTAAFVQDANTQGAVVRIKGEMDEPGDFDPEAEGLGEDGMDEFDDDIPF
jgi:hypothetical protein